MFLGASGCSKSTLMNNVAGFLDAMEGHIEIDGRGVTGPGPNRGVVFQNADEAEPPRLTVSQNNECPLRVHSVSRAERPDLIACYVRLVNLVGRKSKYPSALLGGMR